MSCVQSVTAKISNWIHEKEVITRTQEVAVLVTQTAIRILFIMSSILMAAAVFPLSMHGVIIPLVGCSATLSSAFLFQESNDGPWFGELPPLLKPAVPQENGQMPADFPVDAPRPLKNRGTCNCQLNSIVSMIESIPQVAHWVRHPLRDDVDQAGFDQFLAGYNVPAQVVADFTAYVNLQPHPRPTIPDLFETFLNYQNDPNGYQPAPADRFGFNKIKLIYENLRILSPALARFFGAYDEALQGNLAEVGLTTQVIRVALNKINDRISANPCVQIDAAEPLTYIFDLLPDHLKMSVETTYNLKMDGLPPLLEARAPTQERVTFFTLEFDDHDANPNLTAIVQNYMTNEGNIEPVRSVGIDGAVHSYPVRNRSVSLLEPPPYLIFHLKRFRYEEPPQSWVTKILSSIFRRLNPQFIKKDAPVSSPNELEINTVAGPRRYRLASFVNHIGKTCNSGHYVAGREVNGQKYFASDEEISFLDQGGWDSMHRNAYLLCYLPV